MIDSDKRSLQLIYENVATIASYKELYNRGEYEKCTELADKAGDTQRGIPEETMLTVCRFLQQHYAAPMLVNLLEHIGDLAHRAQEPYGQAIGNVDDKIQLIEKTMTPQRWSLEKEFEEGFLTNAEDQVVRETPELKDLYDSIGKPEGPTRAYEVYEIARTKYKQKIAEQLDHNKRMALSKLPEYVEAHKKHNIPVTYLGHLGKRAAIYLGKLDFDNLRRIVQLIRAWINQYNKLEGVERTKFFLKPISDM